MAAVKVLDARGMLEDVCGRQGTGLGAVAQGFGVKPRAFCLHRAWHRPDFLDIGGEFRRLA